MMLAFPPNTYKCVLDLTNYISYSRYVKAFLPYAKYFEKMRLSMVFPSSEEDVRRVIQICRK